LLDSLLQEIKSLLGEEKGEIFLKGKR